MTSTELEPGGEVASYSFSFNGPFYPKNPIDDYRSFEMTIDQIIDTGIAYSYYKEDKEEGYTVFCYNSTKEWGGRERVKINVVFYDNEVEYRLEVNGNIKFRGWIRHHISSLPDFKVEELKNTPKNRQTWLDACWQPLCSTFRWMEDEDILEQAEIRKEDYEKELADLAMKDFCDRFATEEDARKMITCLRTLISGSRKRAGKMDLDFDIDEEYIFSLYDGKCGISGIDFVLCSDKEYSKQPFKPSLDRIKNKKGYVKGNIRIVCTMINFAKNVWSDKDLKRMLDSYKYLNMREGVQ